MQQAICVEWLLSFPSNIKMIFIDTATEHDMSDTQMVATDIIRRH